MSAIAVDYNAPGGLRSRAARANVAKEVLYKDACRIAYDSDAMSYNQQMATTSNWGTCCATDVMSLLLPDDTHKVHLYVSTIVQH